MTERSPRTPARKTAGPFYLVFLALALPAALALAACEDDEQQEAAGEAKEEAPAAEADDAEPAAEPIEPLPEKAEDVDPKKVALGRSLYFDPILSKDGSVSCASCHMVEHGGAEPKKVSTGIGGAQGPINSPTVLNARYNLAQFWDGRARDLAHQAEGPVANAKEMGADWDKVVKRLRDHERYAKQFEELYGGITKAHVTDAIAEFERSLITPSPFDAYLRGDEDAISEQAKEGYATFKEVGCTACHRGVNIGGGMYQRLGLANDYFADVGRELTDADYGRYNVTKKEEDKHKFKVPTLRNVEKTAPYFHDGSKLALDEAVRAMGHYQLDKKLSDDQVADMVAFLKSLTGKVPEHFSPPEALAAPKGQGQGDEAETDDKAGGEAAKKAG